MFVFLFFFSSRRRHTRFSRDWSSDVCSSDLNSSVSTCCTVSDADSASSGTGDGIPRRSEERRVGKECRTRWSAYHLKKKTKTVQTGPVARQQYEGDNHELCKGMLR